MSTKIRTAVIGGGRIGTIHIANIFRSTQMVLAAFVDVNQERAKQIKEETNCEIYSSIEELFTNAKDTFDAVVICSPTKTHVEFIKLCLENHKPVLCEKPISMEPAEIKSVYELAKEKNVPLLCGYHRRHDASFKALRDLVRKGGVGALRSIRTCSRDNPIPLQEFLKISGGIMHDCASHDIDIIRWIVGEEPVEVYASASTFLERIKDLGDWDTVSIHLRFPSGVLGTVDICRSAPYGYDQRIEVLGETGMLQAENKRPTTVVHSTAGGVSIDPNCFSFPQRYNETYEAELAHFVDVIKGKAELSVTGEDCYRDAFIIDLCEQSAKQNVPLKVNLDY